jgi:hypothetical protein
MGKTAGAAMPASGPVTITSPDDSVSLTVPAGAAPAGTSVSITSGLAGSSYGLGQSSAAQITELQPERTCVGGSQPGKACLADGDCPGAGASCQPFTFGAPVTVTFRWLDQEVPGTHNITCPPDTPGDDTVDDLGIADRNLKLFRNGVNFYTPKTKTCQDVPECDRCANTWTIAITQFSEWAAIRNCDRVKSARLKVSKLGDPPGDDVMTIKATFQRPGDAPSQLFDASSYGLELLLDDVAGTVLRAELPAVTYDPVTKVGWKVKDSATARTLVYRNKSAHAPGGIDKVTLRIGNGPGTVSKITLNAKGGTYPITPAVRMTFVFPGLSNWEQGATCVEATFPGGSPPAPTCEIKGGGTSIVCKGKAGAFATMTSTTGGS